MSSIEFIEENGVLRVRGSKSRYFRLEADQSLEFSVASLSYYGSEWTFDHIKIRESDPIEHQFNERLTGHALLQNSQLQVFGLKSAGANKVKISLVPVTDEDLTKPDPLADRYNFKRYRYWEGNLHYFADDNIWVLDFLVPSSFYESAGYVQQRTPRKAQR